MLTPQCALIEVAPAAQTKITIEPHASETDN